jgi:uncharacterized protein (TIGR02001 family)
MCKRTVLLSAAMIVAAPLHSHAQSSSWKLYPSISLTSDYRYNGVSYSDEEPAAQLSVYLAAPHGLYFGVWSTQVDFNDPGNTSYEVDLYAGKTFRIADSEIGIEALYTFFPDKSFAGPTYDFLQGKLRARRIFDRLALGGHVAWTSEASYASGTALRTALDSSYEMTRWAKAGVNIGRRWIEIGADRTYWDAGFTFTWRRFAFDLRYVDTNLDASQCGFRRACDATLVATVTANLW